MNDQVHGNLQGKFLLTLAEKTVSDLSLIRLIRTLKCERSTFEWAVQRWGATTVKPEELRKHSLGMFSGVEITFFGRCRVVQIE